MTEPDDKNPYHVQGPIARLTTFFGREQELDEIIGRIMNDPPTSTILIGGRAIGKTSLLLEIRNRFLEEANAKADAVVPVLIDLQGILLSDISVVFEAIVSEIARSPSLGKPKDPRNDVITPTGDPYQVFQKNMLTLRNQFREHAGPVRFVILIDEADKLLGHPWTKDVFSNFRHLISVSDLSHSVVLVIVGSRELDNFALGGGRDGGSPFGTMTGWTRLGVLTQDACRELILVSMQGTVQKEVIEAVCEQSGGHPFITRYLMGEIWKSDSADITPEEVEEISTKLTREGGRVVALFQSWQESFTDLDRQAYRVLAEAETPLTIEEIQGLSTIAVAPGRIRDSMRFLIYTGIVVERDRGYSVAGRLHRDWFLWYFVGKEGEAPEEPEERETQKSWSPPLAGYTADAATGDDKLGIMTEVNAFSSVIAFKDLRPPLCLGVFGDWGSGKTFFMNKMSKQVARLAEEARKAEKAKKEEDQETYYCSRVVQITFNAWHYIDANLWACLVNHIFEGLDRFIAQEEKEEKRKHLLRELKLATEERAEAENKKKAAEQHLSDIEIRLKEAQRKRAKASLDLRDLLADLSLERILDEDQRDQLRTLARRLGLPEAYQGVEELNSALKDTRTLGGRLQVALFAPKNRGLGFIWLLIALVVIPLVGICVHRFLNWLGDFPDLVDTVAAVLLQVVAFAASVTGGLNTLLRRTTPVVDELEGVLANAQERLQQRREQISEKEAFLLADLSMLKEREAAASRAFAEAQAQVEKAELALQELEADADERRLAEFIQERVASEDYKRHLGVISTIREDLEFLSCKLRPTKECREKGIIPDTATDETLPRIDRIVLYIDDLDRCPEERVVEVLQAVHLLLAFELFVVVVGVDSRWLLRSLEETYSALQMGERGRAGWSEEEVWAWQSTPQNYLEKIFQIPYNLRSMDQDGFRELVTSILPPMATSPSGVPASASSAMDVETGGIPPSELEGDSGIDSAGIKAETGDRVERGPDDADAQATEIPPTEEEPPTIDLTPDILRIEEVERAFISRLAAMIPTPRAAKRFINIYRLIRATIPPEDLSTFVGDPDDSGEHRAVMILLAILTGFSRQAPYVFRKILSLPPDSRWESTINTLRPRQIPGVEAVQYHNSVVPVMNAGEAIQWKRLHTSLSALGQVAALSETLSPYIKWAPRVARFSFRVGKVIGGADLAVDVRITHVELDPSGPDAAGEYVRIENLGNTAQPMKAWTLSDRIRHTFPFPEFVLPAGGTVNVWVGEGKNTSTDLYWGRRAPVWNNVGDTAELRDDSGVLVSTYTATSEV